MTNFLRRLLRPRPYAAPVRLPVLVVTPTNDAALLEEIRTVMRGIDAENAIKRQEEAVWRFYERIGQGRTWPRDPKTGRFLKGAGNGASN